MNTAINFLDSNLTRDPTYLGFSFYRKLTTSNFILPKVSYRPIKHKLAGIRHVINCTNIYPFCS
jgi:hypothetical protein